MKFIRLATITALSTTIFVGSTTVALAQEAREVTTDGQIEFIPDETSELEVIPPESGPAVDIDPEVEGTTGPLSIVKAAHMNFGTQLISNQNQTYNMVAEMQQLRGTEGDENKVPYVSFAQVQDLRGSNEGWDLKVRLSEFESNTQNNVLTGVHLQLNGARIQYEGSNSANEPTAHADGLILLPNDSGQSIMMAAEGQGAGASSVVWGNQSELNAQFEDTDVDVVKNEAIKLFVPGSTAKDATIYTSTLTWELEATPGEEV